MVKKAKVSKVSKPAKKVVKRATKKAASPKIPLYNAKEVVKLSDLARELDMDYRSMFLKQKRLGALSHKRLLGDKEVVCFTHEQADMIRKSTAPYITRADVELVTIEKACKIDRPKMLRVLEKLKIVPEKRRRHEENPRSVLTVKHNRVKAIKEGAKALFQN